MPTAAAIEYSCGWKGRTERDAYTLNVSYFTVLDYASALGRGALHAGQLIGATVRRNSSTLILAGAILYAAHTVSRDTRAASKRTGGGSRLHGYYRLDKFGQVM